VSHIPINANPAIHGEHGANPSDGGWASINRTVEASTPFCPSGSFASIVPDGEMIQVSPVADQLAGLGPAVDELSFEEISDRLGISRHAIYRRWTSALKQMRAELLSDGSSVPGG